AAAGHRPHSVYPRCGAGRRRYRYAGGLRPHQRQALGVHPRYQVGRCLDHERGAGAQGQAARDAGAAARQYQAELRVRPVGIRDAGRAQPGF
nr:hypothetical protein [Tanacetum cinerariifolium]